MNQNPQPVFIVGMNGSGTTMLLDCLGFHPQLYGFPVETRVLPDLLERFAGDLSDDTVFEQLWQAVRSIPAFGVMNHDEKPPLPDNWREFPRQVAVVVDHYFRFFASQHNKVRWLEKTPQHAQHLPLLASVFPDAKFIHMIRDGRDCAASFNRRWKRTPELTIYRWKNVVRLCRERGQLLGAERYIELHYEVLTQDPERWMRQVCQFIGVEYDTAVLKSRLPQQGKEDDSGTITAQAPRWRKSFNDRTVRGLERIAGGLLDELGYPVSELGNDNPKPLRLRIWRGLDYARQYGNEIKEKLQGKSNKSWHIILRLPLIAISQARSQRF